MFLVMYLFHRQNSNFNDIQYEYESKTMVLQNYGNAEKQMGLNSRNVYPKHFNKTSKKRQLKRTRKTTPGMNYSQHVASFVSLRPSVVYFFVCGLNGLKYNFLFGHPQISCFLIWPQFPSQCLWRLFLHSNTVIIYEQIFWIFFFFAILKRFHLFFKKWINVGNVFFVFLRK